MTTTHRLLPPLAVAQQTLVVNGRTYTAQPGTAVDVPDFDAGVLEANGWIFVAKSGPTTARPTPTNAGEEFYDISLDALIMTDGVTWRSPVDGTSV